MIRTTLALLVAAFLVAAPAAAQSSRPDDVVIDVATDADTVVPSRTRGQLTLSPEPRASVAPPASLTLDSFKRRQPILTGLLVSYTTLQVLDLHSTRRGLALGGIEANPVMATVTGNAFAFGAVKVGLSALTIFTAEKLRKRSPAAALAVMIGANAVSAFVVAKNYRYSRQ